MHIGFNPNKDRGGTFGDPANLYSGQHILPARMWFVLDASATLKGATDQSIQLGGTIFESFKGSVVTCDTEVPNGVPLT